MTALAKATSKEIAAALARQAERRRLALEALASAETVSPVCPAVFGIGTLVGLEREGLAERLPDRDQLGDLRFRITEAGRAVAAA